MPVGRVGRPHGLDGSFVVENASESPERFAEGATLYVEGEPAVVVATKRAAGGRPVVRLDRSVARGQTLAVALEALPPPEEDAYYVFELVGLRVVERSGRELGRVRAVEPGVANDVLELDSGESLPFVGACVLEVDLERGAIVVSEGFAGPP